jgi:hypothetical protein
MDAWRYEIYLLVFKLDISLEDLKINFISLCTHVLFSIYHAMAILVRNKRFFLATRSLHTKEHKSSVDGQKQRIY